jgi:hypothetical protein
MFSQALGKRGKDVWPAEIEDISVTGLGIMTDHEFPPGAILSIRLLGEGFKSRSYLIRVVRCTPTEDGLFRLGCTFAVPLPPEELEGLLKGLLH